MSTKSGVCSLFRVTRYNGLRRPRCHVGVGCWLCWAKYNSLPAQRLRRLATAVEAAVDAVKKGRTRPFEGLGDSYGLKPRAETSDPQQSS
jgi:hypothetical protein